MKLKEYGHTPVLVNEVLNGLKLRPDGFYVDCTFGRGGHTLAILGRLGGEGRVLAFDKDPDAVTFAGKLAESDRRFSCIRGSFTNLYQEIERLGRVGKVDGVLFDLGVSSPQLDEGSRGFSFSKEGELDMRMDPATGISAADWINRAEERELARVLFEYGEERYARRIAAGIARARKQSRITTTTQLAGIIASTVPKRERDKHPATRSFQGIRIFINNELEELRQGLAAAVKVLASGGRLVVISFHSLEDRIVKRFMRDLADADPYPKDLPVPTDSLHPKLRVVGKVVKPRAEEIESNPRARSARLRIAEALEA